LLFIRPERGGAPHAKNNAKAVPEKLIDVFQWIERDASPRCGAFGVFLTGRA
jgi:hypothetical protein